MSYRGALSRLNTLNNHFTTGNTKSAPATTLAVVGEEGHQYPEVLDHKPHIKVIIIENIQTI